MAGITDLPFRRIVSRFKTGQFVSEMIASQEILSGRPGVRQKAELGTDKANTSVQISGRDPYAISETAKLVEGIGAKIIDIIWVVQRKKL
jgi:tRNA-dihydrouridine synthase